MLPEACYQKITEYKKDTDSLANWLATTAEQYGYTPDLLNRADEVMGQPASKTPLGSQPLSDQTRKGRLKGKARKITREAASLKAAIDAKIATPNTLPSKPYTIAIKSFVTLASHIVAFQKPLANIPIGVEDLLNRAIANRKQLNTYFTREIGEQSNSNNTGHAHFITVLERVREILEPYVLRRGDTGHSREAMSTLSLEAPDQSRRRNVYEALEVEQPSKVFLDSPVSDSTRPSTVVKKQDDIRYQAERLPKAEEQILGASNLISDVQGIREYLRGLWKTYHLNNIDLQAASITTNTAIAVVRSLQEDYDVCHPDHADFRSVAGRRYSDKCRSRHQDPGTQEHVNDIVNLTMYDAAEEVFLPTYIILDEVRKFFAPGKLWLFSAGEAMPRDTSKPWSAKSWREKIEDDKLVILEAITSFTILASLDLDSSDQLLRGFQELSPDRSVPLWVVFAVQVFLDIQHELGLEVGKAFHELQNGAAHLKSSMNQSINLHKDQPDLWWPTKYARALPAIINNIVEWTEKDIIQEAMTLAIYDNQCSTRWNKPYHLLNQHPVLCGLWLFDLRNTVQFLSLSLTAKWQSIKHCAHLYNALRNEGLVDRWEDMETLIMIQGVDNLFFGKRPEDTESYFKRWSLSSGCSATHMAKAQRSDHMKYSAANIRGLRKTVGVSSLFAGRDSDTIRSSNAHLSALRARIESIKTSGNIPNGSAKMLNHNQTAKKEGLSKPQAEDKDKDEEEFASIHLLGSLADCLNNEGIHITFDYIRFHRLCHKILGDMKYRLFPEDNNTSVDRDSRRKAQRNLPFIVGDILSRAAEWELPCRRKQRSKTDLRKKPRGEHPEPNTTLVEAANIMNDAIKDEAGSLIRNFCKRSLGHAVI